MTAKKNFDAHRAAVLRQMHDDRVKAAAEAAKAKANDLPPPDVEGPAELEDALAREAANDIAVIESQVNG